MSSSGDDNEKEQFRHPRYSDFARCSFDEVVDLIQTHSAVGAAGNKSKSISERSRGGAKITFPMRLHALIESLPSTETAITWQPHGRAFKINSRYKFENEILPRSFIYSCQYASFQRQLNIYSFMRISRGPDAGAYYNSLFLRSRPDLCSLMPRKVSKKNTVRKSIDAATEPDLSKLSFMPSQKSSTASSGLSNVANSSSMMNVAAKSDTEASSFLVSSSESSIDLPGITPTTESKDNKSSSGSAGSTSNSGIAAAAVPALSSRAGRALPNKRRSTIEGKLPGSLFLDDGGDDEEESGAASNKRFKLDNNSNDTDSKPEVIIQGTASVQSRASNFPNFPSTEAAQPGNTEPTGYMLPLESTSNIGSTAVEDQSTMAFLLQDIDMDLMEYYQ